jgi:M6 family metalloprotease-like protein
LLRIVVTLLIAAAGAAFGGVDTSASAPELESVSQACTQVQKRTRSKALAAYKKLMPKQRKAYFKRVKSAKKRKAFVKKQQAKLKRLKTAAGCPVVLPRPPAPRPPTPGPGLPLPVSPPAAPPPVLPSDVTPPTLTSAAVSGETLTLGFDEPIATVSATSVTADGVAVGIAGTAVSGATVVLTLTAATEGNDVVLVNGRFADATGNQAVLVSNGVTNLAGPSFAPALAKASWADDRSSDAPEFGEWPIDHRYFLPATRVRTVMIFVDFPSKPHTIAPQLVFDTWNPVATTWFKRASYARFDFAIDLVNRVYHLSRDDYGPLDTGGGGNLRTLIAEATQLADADVDFSKYDAVWVIEPSGGIGNRQLRPWPEDSLVLDGKPILHAELADAGVLTAPFINETGHFFDNRSMAHLMVTHETGHHLGLPDTSYKPDPETPYDFSFVAGWDVMDNPAGMAHGADLFAWNKQRLGWIDPKQIRGLTAPGTVEETITPVGSAGGVKLVVAQTLPTFLYAVEVRRRLGNDAAMTCDEGVLVYTVDSTKRNGLGPKFVHAAHMGSDQSKISTCGAKYAAPFDVGPGEVSVFEDSAVKVEVLSTDGVNYRVRVTRK